MSTRMFQVGCRGLVLAGAVFASSVSQAEVTRFYELEGFEVLLNGNPESTALTEDGAITLPPMTKEWFADPAASFSAAAVWGDEVVVARVDTGKVIAINEKGEEREVFEPEETIVTSMLAVGDDLLVSAAPPGRIYRVKRDGTSEVFYEAESVYVWDMVAGDEGSVYLALGEPGVIVHVDADGEAEPIFISDQEHMRSVAYDATYGVFAGGGEKGIVYRQAKGTKEFQALYDTRTPEITALLIHDGYVFVAGVKGAAALIEEANSTSPRGSARKKGKGKGGSEVHSQLVRVSMGGTGEVLAGSNDEAIFAMAVDQHGTILVATGATGREDPRGRLYAVVPRERQVSLVYQSPSRWIGDLVPHGKDGLIAISGAGGRIVSLGSEFRKTGEFLTKPFDTNINAKFGRIQLFGIEASRGRAKVAIRTGQSAVPDASWSPWSNEIGMRGGSTKHALTGRYMQARITLVRKGDLSPIVHRLRVAYLRENLPPFVREIVALKKGISMIPVVAERSGSKVVTVGDKIPKEVRRSTGDGVKGPTINRTKARQLHRSGALTVRWVAEDPNGDDLEYDLEVRTEGDEQWHTLDAGMQTPYYTLQSSQLPDGHYQFRVKASDAPSNPTGSVHVDTRESRAVLVDNTPPRVGGIDLDRDGDEYRASVKVEDNIGPLVEAVFSLNGAPFRMVLPADGILDGPEEMLDIPLGRLDAGRYTLTVRVRDDAGNDSVGELRFEVAR